jgi:AcrR family transcriptional regulator
MIKTQQGKRLTSSERRHQRDAILDTAVEAAAVHGYAQVTRDQVATAAGVSPALVSAYLGTVPKFRRDIMRRAVVTENLTVLAQGITAKDSHALKISDELKQRAIDSLRC